MPSETKRRNKISHYLRSTIRVYLFIFIIKYYVVHEITSYTLYKMQYLQYFQRFAFHVNYGRINNCWKRVEIFLIWIFLQQLFNDYRDFKNLNVRFYIDEVPLFISARTL